MAPSAPAKTAKEAPLALTKAERDLILKIRERFRFGEIVVETRDGQPYRIKKTVEYEKLGQ